MTDGKERVPEAIASKLTELLRRFQHVVFLKGLGVTVAVFLGSTLAAIALDRLFVIPTTLRLALTVSALGVTAAAAYAYWARPCLRRPDDVALAASVEMEHPELEERVSSTIELLTKEERPEYRGSRELIHAVAAQAVMSVRRVDFTEVVSADRARKSTIVAGFLLLVTLGVALVWWTDFKQLVHRFAVPWADLARVSDVRITVQEPGDKTVVKGESVHIAASVSPSTVLDATLHIELEPDRWVPVRMTAAEPGSFSHRLTDVTSSMRYYISAGDGVTRRYGITAVERPRIVRSDLRYDYPEYTRRKAKEEPDAPGDIRAVVGTQVTLDVTVNKDLRKARLEMTGVSEPLEMQAAGPHRFRAKFTLASSGLYVPRLEDEYGFTNQDEEARQVIAEPDASPVVTITSPERNVKLHEAGELPVIMRARDDFAVMKMGIVCQVNGGEDKELSVPVQPAGSPEVTTSYAWDLAGLGLKPGDSVAYRAKATDNRPGSGPNVGFSETHTLLITSPSYEVDRAIREKQLEDVRTTLAKLKRELGDAKSQEQQWKTQAERKALATDFQKRLKPAVEEELKKAEPLAKELARLLKNDPLLEDLSPKAEEIGQKNVPEARKATEQINLEKPLNESEQSVDKAQAEINEALRKVDEMSKDVERLAKNEEQERKLADLAEKEKQLAAEAGNVPKEQQEQGEKVADKQDELKGQLDKMMDQAMKQEALKKGLDELKQTKEDIENLAKKEEDLKKRTEEAAKPRSMDELTKKQEALKQEAGKLEQQAQGETNKEKPRGEQATQEMQQALDNLKQAAPKRAMEHQEKAAKQLDQLADNLAQQAQAAKPEAGKPESLANQMAQKARELSKEQRQLEQELARNASPPNAPNQEMQQLAQEQNQLEQQARETGRRMDELAGALQEMQPQAAQQAQKAQDAMKQVPSQMQEAGKDLQASKPEQAAGQEQEAANGLKEAAREAGKLGDELARAAEQGKGKPEPGQGKPEPGQGKPEPGQGKPGQGAPGLELAKALSRMQSASEEMRAQQPQQGSQAMQQAAQHLAQAAQQMMSGGLPGQPGQLSQSNLGPKTFNPSGVRGPGPKVDGFELKKLDLTAEEWNRLPGEMQEKLLQAMKGKYPEEYRQLIRDYFTHLAKTGVTLDGEESK